MAGADHPALVPQGAAPPGGESHPGTVVGKLRALVAKLRQRTAATLHDPLLFRMIRERSLSSEEDGCASHGVEA